MTREEAIGVLEDIRDAICENIPGSHPELDELKEAVQMAVNALVERKKGEWLHDILQDAIDAGIITEVQAVRIMERVKA